MNDPSDALTLRSRARVGLVLRDKWRIESILGVGGMAVVYTATHTNNGRKVAIKMLHPELGMNSELKNRFLREGYVANKIAHSGAVAILDDDQAEDGSVFLVMELLEGETLETRRVRKGGRLDQNEILAVSDQVLDVLISAHEKGIVHRDIKPDNVFLTAAGVKLLDFGIARIRELQSRQATMTGAGAMGTPAFMPPEQARGRWDQVGPRTDLWALGATMFSLASGRCVHTAETLNEVLLAAMTSPAPAMATVVPGLAPQFCALIDRALAYEMNERWADARAMQRALREAYQSMSDDGPATDRGLGAPVLPELSFIQQPQPQMPAAALITGPRPPPEFAAPARAQDSFGPANQSFGGSGQGFGAPAGGAPSDLVPGAGMHAPAPPHAMLTALPGARPLGGEPPRAAVEITGGPAFSAHATTHAVAIGQGQAGARGRSRGVGFVLAAAIAISFAGIFGIYRLWSERANPSAGEEHKSLPAAAATDAPSSTPERAKAPIGASPTSAAAPTPAPEDSAAPAVTPAAESSASPTAASAKAHLEAPRPRPPKREHDLLNRRN